MNGNRSWNCLKLTIGLQKKALNIQARNQKLFRAVGVSWNKGTLINIACTTNKRKASQVKKHSDAFVVDPLKFNHNQGTFFENPFTFFNFRKKAGEASPCPPPLYTWLHVSNYLVKFNNKDTRSRATVKCYSDNCIVDFE